MSRREEQLRKMRDQKISERVSNIYLSSITEVLFEAGVKKEDIEFVKEMIDRMSNKND